MVFGEVQIALVRLRFPGKCALQILVRLGSPEIQIDLLRTHTFSAAGRPNCTAFPFTRRVSVSS